ncbi:MAG: SiaB family protein kinase [Bacteroidales bacterium]|nr:SiaB family protein kinase [Bacteroidales bacterium]
MRHLETFRDIFNQGSNGQLILAFNGDFNQDTIVSLGEVVRNEVSATSNAALARRAFTVFVEMAQNILHYSLERGIAGQGRGRFLLLQASDGFHLLTFNLISTDQMDYLKRRIGEINRMGPDELKSSYLSKRRQRVPEKKGGAGLGLMDIARRSGMPLGIGFLAEGEGKLRFYLRTIISW